MKIKGLRSSSSTATTQSATTTTAAGTTAVTTTTTTTVSSTGLTFNSSCTSTSQCNTAAGLSCSNSVCMCTGSQFWSYSSSACKACQSSWTGYSDFCWQYFATNVNYATATTNCRNLGAGLMTIESLDKFLYMVGKISTYWTRTNVYAYVYKISKISKLNYLLIQLI